MRLSTVFAALSLALQAAAQWNIDLDDPGAPPQLGGGVPSDSFGAAAGQAGRWNSLFGFGPQQMMGLSGDLSGMTLSVASSGGGLHIGSYNFAGNTGDIARLLNDSYAVGSFIDGGTLTFTFAGMPGGTFDIYTYAVSPVGNAVPCSIRVPGAVSNETQVVTGPMPGNAFGLSITHCIHRVSLAQEGGLVIIATQAPNTNGCYVNGFQIVAVPEPPGALCLLLGTYATARVAARRKSG